MFEIIMIVAVVLLILLAFSEWIKGVHRDRRIEQLGFRFNQFKMMSKMMIQDTQSELESLRREINRLSEKPESKSKDVSIGKIKKSVEPLKPSRSSHEKQRSHPSRSNGELDQVPMYSSTTTVTEYSPKCNSSSSNKSCSSAVESHSSDSSGGDSGCGGGE